MITLSFQKRLGRKLGQKLGLYTTGLAVFSLAFTGIVGTHSAEAAETVGATPSSEASNAYLVAFLKNLPAGKTMATASTQEFKDAVQRTVLADPGHAAAIAGAITAAASIGRAVEVADAIGQLFARNPKILAAATAIAKAITESLDAKNAPHTDRARQIGYCASTIIYYLNLADQSIPDEEALDEALGSKSVKELSRDKYDRMMDLINTVVAINPRLDFTNIIVGIITQTLVSIGAPAEFQERMLESVLNVVTDPAVQDQIRTAYFTARGNTNLFLPGYINLHETPISNG